MESKRTGAALAALGLIVAVVLFIVLRNGDDGGGEQTTAATTTTQATTTQAGNGEEPEPAEPKPATIVVEGGQPVGGVQELEFEQGGEIRFVVESDVDEEVHLHGYDIGKDVSAGGKVEFNVPAEIAGVFEVELERSVVPLAEITVNPA